MDEQRVRELEQGVAIKHLPGLYEVPEFKPHHLDDGRIKQVPMRRSAKVSNYQLAKNFCDELGGRLPTSWEWEKAARGEDGRLYPWGNEWDESRGWFYSGQYSDEKGDCVDVYPQGVSQYGVWGMAGNLPEDTSSKSPSWHCTFPCGKRRIHRHQCKLHLGLKRTVLSGSMVRWLRNC